LVVWLELELARVQNRDREGGREDNSKFFMELATLELSGF